ncbi:MAG: C25 family cysteine peptidase [Candidatus Amulumruptor caecigallinarius]|nr:C25 family cysteine peptidase [Candidatus Amulumruptor caecigallinarius]MCM1397211.1 C25 family cysteine peptidase [Candidatus Amulumruptor caecigallinarius]MCM1453100.1 C25 family cysteine peptidase [bacterium]
MNLKTLLRPALAIAVLIGAALFPAQAAGALSFPASSKLATPGHWVKITCDKPGMQQITYDRLREWGFADPSKVRVYGYSTARMFVNKGYYGDFNTPGLPTDLQVVKTLRWPESSPRKLIFYNEGQFAHDPAATSVQTYINFYDTTASYLLTDARTDNDAIETQPYLSGRGTTYSYHRSLIYVNDQTHNPLSGGALYTGEPWATTTKDVSFTLTDPTPGLSNSYSAYFFFNVAFSPVNVSTGSLEMKADLIAADYLSQISTTNLKAGADATALHITQKDGYNRFKIASGAPNLLPVSFTLTRANLAENYKCTVYPRHYALTYMRNNLLRPEEGQMTMYFDFITVANSRIQFKGEALPLGQTSGSTTPLRLANDMYVWDVSYPLFPLNLAKKLTSSYASDTATYEVTIPTHSLDANVYGSRLGSYPLVAFRPSSTLHEPVLAAEVKPQNLHAMEQCDMLIITTETLRPEAERLAQAHRDLQGLAVNVVTHDEILNEFTGGTRHAMAYRLLAKMLYDRNATSSDAKFRYILLFGPAVWDNLHTILPKGEYLLSYETHLYNYVNFLGRNFASNDYFGDLADDVNETNLPTRAASVAVGHIDAYNLGEAAAAVNKTIAYIKNPPMNSDVLTRALYLSDSGVSFRNDAIVNSDRAIGFRNDLTAERLFLDLASDKPNGDTSLRDRLAESLTEGRYYWNYSGHADPVEFRSTKPIWNNALAATTKYDLPPVAMFGTCETYVFDHMDGGIVHRMMMNERGGIIAGVASCRSVYHTQNNIMARGFERALFDDPASRGITTVGDLYVRAKSNTLTESSESGPRLYGNTRCFNLVGDPAVPVYYPTSHVLLSEVNGTAIDSNPNNQEAASVTAVPDKPFTIKGFIAADSTKTDVTTTFNGTVYITVFDHPRSERTLLSTAADIATDHVPLLRTAAVVTDGVFSATLTLPAGTTGSADYNRITLLAVREGATETAAGASTVLSLLPYDATQAITDTEAPVIEQAYINTEDFVDGMTILPSPEPTLYVHATDCGLGFSSGYATGSQAFEVSVDGKPCADNATSRMRTLADGTMMFTLPLGNLAPGDHVVSISATDRVGNTASRTLYFRIAPESIPATISVAEEPARTQATITVTTSETLSNPQVTAVIRDAAGRTVRTITGSSTDINWDLTDSNGSPVADGTYTIFAQITDRGATGHTNAIPVIVIR